MRVEKLLERLKREFIKVNLLQASLDAILFFLSVNFVLFLFSIQLVEGFQNTLAIGITSAAVLLVDLAYRARKYRLEIYEEKNPELREILRTARDNLDQQNVVSQALFDEVLDQARSVTSESIIPSKAIIQKILAVGILSFLTLLTGITSFQIQEEGGRILPDPGEFGDPFNEEEEGFELKNDTSIYGQSQEIESSDLDIGFNITGGGDSPESEKSGGGRREELVLDVSSDSLSQDVELAKQYSLAIKEFETNS